MTRSRHAGRPRDMLRDASDTRTVEVDLVFLRRAGEAVVFKTADEEEVLLPASQVSFDEDVGFGDTVVATIPEWLAMGEGLV